MRSVRDIFAWLDDAQAVVDEDGHQVHQAFQSLRRAHQSQDDEGVRTARDELVQLSRAHELPWLEVFGRHWEMQYRLIERREGASAVADVVALFELSHRKENIDCPQTICSAQDLCIAYSRCDGPGYADEVIVASQDTLSRIDPSWPCYDCVSSELRTGLMHARRFDEAIELIDEVEVAIRLAGADPTLGYERDRVGALVGLGQIDKAVAVVDSIEVNRFATHSDYARDEFAVEAAVALVYVGRGEEALATYRSCVNPLDRPVMALPWLELSEALLDAGLIDNNDDLSHTKVRIAHLLHGRGSYRDAFTFAASAAMAAARRGAASSAERALRLAELYAEDLAKPVDAPDKLAAVRAAIEVAPVEPDESADLDTRIEPLEALRRDGALPIEQLLELGQLLAAQGWVTASQELLREHVDAHPDDEGSVFQLFGLLMHEAKHDEAVALADIHEPHDASNAKWIRANVAAAQLDWAGCASWCAEIVALDPSVRNTRRLWMQAARKLGDFAEAARLAHELLDTEPDDPAPDAWAAVVVGSVQRDWVLVRQACALLEIELSTPNGAVVERWGTCDITFRDDDGHERTHVAERTGPATAQVLSVAHPRRVQRVKDVVVFEPTSLDPESGEHTDDEGNVTYRPHRYNAVVTLDAANYRSFSIEGIPPSTDAWLTVRDELVAAGFPVWNYAGSIVEGADGEDVEVLYALAAVGPEAAAEGLAEALESLTTAWAPALAWPGLADQTNRDGDAHRARLEAIWSES